MMGCFVSELAQREREIIALREAEGVIGGATGVAAKLGVPGKRWNQRSENWESTAINTIQGSPKLPVRPYNISPREEI
jgi:hypothetical protein